MDNNFTPNPEQTEDKIDMLDQDDDILSLILQEQNKDNEEEPPSDNEDGEDENILSEESDPEIIAHFNFLLENQILDLEDDFKFDGTKQSFDLAIETSRDRMRNKAAEDLMSHLPDDFKPLIAYGLNGGESVKDYLDTFSPREFESLLLSDPEDQKEILRIYYKTFSNHPNEKINRMINRIDEDELESEAKDALAELTAHKNKEKQEFVERQEKLRKDYEDDIKKRAQDLAQAIETYEIDPTRKSKIKGFFFNQIKENGVYTNGFNKTIESILNNPTHQAQLADLLLEYTPSKGIDTSRFEVKAKTNKVKSYKEYLDKAIQTKTTTKKTPASPKQDSFDWEAFVSS